MKQITLFITAILLSLAILAQAPMGINYQTVIRDGDGNILPYTELSLQMTIRSGAPDGAVVYAETHEATTNAFGLINLVIGYGSPLNNAFADINWGSGEKYLETAIDTQGNGNYTVLGVTQFLSVPYSLHAANGNYSMTSEERDALVNPPLGMQIFNITTNCLNYFNGYGWYETCGDCTPMPSPSNAGADQFFSDATTATMLDANTPEYGTGTWSVVSGNGGSFEDVNDPNTLFTGQACQVYNLKWTITSTCGATEDLVSIEFDTPPSPANAGPDQTYNDATVSTSLEGNTPEIGNGTWSIENGTGGSFDDMNDPITLFTGNPCESYLLKWTVSNPCGSSEDQVKIVFNTPPTAADAGPDQYFEDATTSTMLEGNTPVLGVGTWSVETGTGGSFENVNDPTTLFTGTACETYMLEWIISNPCGSSEDQVEIVFNTPPTAADAGADQYFEDATISTMLEGNTPVLGVGTWSVESGTGGSFENVNDPTTLFTGTACETYILKWIISNPCGSSEDQVEVIFNTPPTPADAGPDQYFEDATISTLLEGNTPVLGEGTWSVESGTGGSFENANDPTTLFIGTSCETYILKWIISNPCGSSEDQVEIVFNTPPTAADAGADQYFEDATISTMLEGNTPVLGVGTWSVESGSGGSFENANDPTTIFTGTACETYILKWIISNPCGSSEDQVEIVFNTPPTVADAGPDQIDVAGTSTSLSANAPLLGSGEWSILSGTGGNIAEPGNPASTFTGTEGITYELQWSITNNCGASTDNVTISFAGGGGEWTCGEPYTDSRDGREYETVVIGDQCWMSENLAYLPTVSPSADGSANDPFYYVYDYSGTDVEEAKATGNFQSYGTLYNYPASQSACPDGWNNPSDDEWKILEGSVDSLYPVGDPEWDGAGWRGFDAGKNLKSTSGWDDNGNGVDLYNFSALPGGFSYPGGFGSLGNQGMWWSSTENSTNPAKVWGRNLWIGDIKSARYDYDKDYGRAVRCLKSDFVPVNQAPESPSSPNPTDGSTDQSIDTDLSWACTDPEGDPLTYDVYFGTDNLPTQVATGQSETTYDPGVLQYDSQYFWKIIAHDDQGNSTEGAVWSFNVIDAPSPAGEVYNPETGRTWMDRNLGASQVATSSDDTAAYGDLYQWGRATEGHESRTSPTTNTQATTPIPNLGNSWDGLFIKGLNWDVTLDITLWQGENGTNNPCPAGFRIPTNEEWIAEQNSWATDDPDGAYGSPLKLAAAGFRHYVDGVVQGDGEAGNYWSSTVYSSFSGEMHFGTSPTGIYNEKRATGISVRCIKEESTN
jgi:uncharacterized protein (TIGR02145 family)